MASVNCGCIPWDFYGKNQSIRECDVFGRTCFLNNMENLTHLSIKDFNLVTNKICSPCNNDCEYMKYHIRQDKEEALTVSWYKGKLLSCNIQTVENCTGEMYDILMDENNTFQSKFFYQHFQMIDNKNFAKSKIAFDKQKYLIVVNLHFVTPEIEVKEMTTKYTDIDKIAGFGGTFGLLTQVRLGWQAYNHAEWGQEEHDFLAIKASHTLQCRCVMYFRKISNV